MLDETIVWILWGVATLAGGFLVFVGIQFLGRGNPLERIRTLDGDALPGAAGAACPFSSETIRSASPNT